MKTQEFNPALEAELVYTPSFQANPMTITGLGETLLPLAEEIKAAEAVPTVEPAKAPQAPVMPVAPQNQYIDMSELKGREIARKKLTARFYDTFHGTNMYGMLVDRINEDRDIAFARGLGIIGVTHCAKHEKAVAKLRQLV